MEEWNLLKQIPLKMTDMTGSKISDLDVSTVFLRFTVSCITFAVCMNRQCWCLCLNRNRSGIVSLYGPSSSLSREEDAGSHGQGTGLTSGPVHTR